MNRPIFVIPANADPQKKLQVAQAFANRPCFVVRKTQRGAIHVYDAHSYITPGQFDPRIATPAF